MFNLIGSDTYTPPDYKSANIKIIASFLIGASAIGLGVSGTVVEKGALKATALITGSVFMGLCCKEALGCATESKVWENQRQVREDAILQASLIEAETALEAYKVVTEENAIRQMAGVVTPAIAPSSVPVVNNPVVAQQPTQVQPLQDIATIQNTAQQPAPAQPVVQAEVVPTVSNELVNPVSTPVISDRPQQMTQLPDGATLIEPSALNDNDKYPVVMVVAEQGSGKSVTLATIFEYLTGKKALATPKKQDHENENLANTYNIRFGYNNDLKQGRWIGHLPDDITAPKWGDLNAQEDQDLTWYLKNKPGGDSYINFVWAVRQESLNRQQYGMSAETEYWRVFGDEWSQTYVGGFKDPMKEPKIVRQAQGYMSACIADAFMNFRGQKVQLWVGSQTESVKTIGMQDMSEARDIAWHLYPGKAAIEAAKKYKKDNLALWLMNRIKAGYGVALLEKNGVFYEVINLPTLEYMRKFDPK